MKLFQARVIQERENLSGNIERPAAFVASAAFESVDKAEQLRLGRQLKIMRDYRDVLDERIAAF